ncbi:hypothetical protein CVT24_008840 [Panaeolus cyanescens]|uniref:Uncharacterized protein n=1 Tax=Panaeolus cyanescens TaxID=181874 RepID=A0A409VKD6_9AGAR|nr:hypothetical protein CVT24_008840 [Panaeolus cyanescens]
MAQSTDTTQLYIAVFYDCTSTDDRVYRSDILAISSSKTYERDIEGDTCIMFFMLNNTQKPSVCCYTQDEMRRKGLVFIGLVHFNSISRNAILIGTKLIGSFAVQQEAETFDSESDNWALATAFKHILSPNISSALKEHIIERVTINAGIFCLRVTSDIYHSPDGSLPRYIAPQLYSVTNDIFVE